MFSISELEFKIYTDTIFAKFTNIIEKIAYFSLIYSRASTIVWRAVWLYRALFIKLTRVVAPNPLIYKLKGCCYTMLTSGCVEKFEEDRAIYGLGLGCFAWSNSGV